jgi:hypothetical protein
MVEVLAKTMRRLFDYTALQQHKGMQTLSASWARFLKKVELLRRTMRKLCDCTALQQHRGMQAVSSTWAPCLSMV